MRASDFSLRALYEALDAERQARGLSWAAATREMNGRVERASARGHQMSASTVKGMGKRTVAEGDGVLAMLRCLKRTPESFVPGHAESGETSARLPEVPAGKVLRFDTKKMHAALEAQRVARGMTWEQVAKEVGLGASGLKHLANGGRTAFPQVMWIVRWLGRPAAEFTRLSDS
jgi:hypothetical protein